MSQSSQQTTAGSGSHPRYVLVLRRIVSALAVVAGAAVAAMIVVTCVDVVGRRFGHPLKGAYDIVEILGAITIAGGLPYTTACKGHVAIEFFFQRLSRTGKIVVDTLVRIVTISMFSFLTWRFVLYGVEVKASGQGTSTMGWPIFWLPWWFSLCCGVMVLVILYHLTHPGKALMKP
ncbi:MAG TPA: TRAP transporter small permease [Sedimentisphaerales bacterium]|nr:TRAP transporter small permease [Sedimentisphaerales bacterium]